MSEKTSWVVKVRCVVEKTLVTHECTFDEAHKDPFDYVCSEEKESMTDYEVVSVNRND
jgi:hypothetical protein